MLITMPSAAPVPTAVCIGVRKAFSSGTDSVPPPMPIKVEMPPIDTPMIEVPTGPGRPSPSAKPSRLKAMFSATNKATVAKIAVRTWPLNKPESTVPSKTPTMTGGISLPSSSRFRLPRLRWARADMIDVGMMVANEVPTATCMRTDSSMPSSVNRWYSTGTMTMPPPTPSRPARMPATTPVASSAAARPSNQAVL